MHSFQVIGLTRFSASTSALLSASSVRVAGSATSTGYPVELWPVALLRPSEAVDESAVQRLVLRIREQGVWTAPIPLDAASGWVMDGNHRLRAARALGLMRVPCVPFDHADPRVQVTDWKTGLPFEPQRLQALSASGALLPYKTTRHRFTPDLPVTAIALDVLQAGA
jgi:hypothetical protein